MGIRLTVLPEGGFRCCVRTAGVRWGLGWIEWYCAGGWCGLKRGLWVGCSLTGRMVTWVDIHRRIQYLGYWGDIFQFLRTDCEIMIIQFEPLGTTTPSTHPIQTALFLHLVSSFQPSPIHLSSTNRFQDSHTQGKP